MVTWWLEIATLKRMKRESVTSHMVMRNRNFQRMKKKVTGHRVWRECNIQSTEKHWSSGVEKVTLKDGRKSLTGHFFGVD